MAEATNIPEPVAAAYALAVDSGIAMTRPIQVSSGRSGGWEFSVSLAIPDPNNEKIKGPIECSVVVPTSFPFCDIAITPLSDEIRGFSHQDAETGKLCLLQEASAPFDATRLKCYIDWASEWLCDAVQGSLLKPGDPYELPDFSRRNCQGKTPLDMPLLFCETPQSFELWKPYIGLCGHVDFMVGRSSQGFVPVRFRQDATTIIQPAFADGFRDTKRQFAGRWILLKDLRYHRHRPPQTYGELAEICRAARVDLEGNLKKCWEKGLDDPAAGVLLIGCPIPKRVGEEPSEVHWQPLSTSTRDGDVIAFKPKYGRIKTGSLWDIVWKSEAFTVRAPLLWCPSRNIAPEQFYARGSYCRNVCDRKIAILGCGALGSALAEMLVRGGASNIVLFDGDSFALENQCRHSLDGRHVGQNKAVALANRLSGVNPLSRIKGFPLYVPFLKQKDKNLDEAPNELASCDILVDCTTDQGAFLWLSGQAKACRCRMASLFLNFGASLLTLCVSGKQITCDKVSRKLYRSIAAGETPIEKEDYFREPSKEEQILAPGCWHPTFPGRNNHILMLAGAAAEILDKELAEPEACDGTATLIRRKSPVDGPGALVEVVWTKKYR